MAPTLDSDSQEPNAASRARACLEQTRSAVLNVLVAVGLMIAVSGWLLRSRAEAMAAEPQPQASRAVHDALMAGLITLGVSGFVLLRLGGRRPAASRSDRPGLRFFWSHVLAASIAALAVPLGLVYGWLVEPTLGAVIPFWVVPLAIGFLAWPRTRALEDLQRTMPGPGVSQP
jgi:hypothetical protein